MLRIRSVIGTAALSAGVICSTAAGQLVVQSQFSAPQGGTNVSVGFSRATDRVWVYAGFTGVIRSYSRAGAVGADLSRPGEAADDADLSFPQVGFTLGTTPIPAGSMLFINGESGVAEVYAINPASGSVLSTLVTSFGTSHVVGGAHHPTRGTIFLVQDRVPGGAAANRIAEVSATTGAVLNTFGTGSADWTVNYGDLEVDPITGNLLLVSSDETSIRVLSPVGAVVGTIALPAGVSELSGISVDSTRGELWVSGINGTVWRLSGLSPACPGDVNGDGMVGLGDIAVLIQNWTFTVPPAPASADLDGSGDVGLGDIAVVIQNWSRICP